MTRVWINDFCDITEGHNIPINRNSAHNGVFELVGLFGSQVAVVVDAAGEEIVHQASFDALLLRNQRLCLCDSPLHRCEYLGNLGLFEKRFWKRNSQIWNSAGLKMKNRRA